MDGGAEAGCADAGVAYCELRGGRIGWYRNVSWCALLSDCVFAGSKWGVKRQRDCFRHEEVRENEKLAARGCMAVLCIDTLLSSP